jgi:hypothetical protein
VLVLAFCRARSKRVEPSLSVDLNKLHISEEDQSAEIDEFAEEDEFADLPGGDEVRAMHDDIFGDLDDEDGFEKAVGTLKKLRGSLWSWAERNLGAR